MLNISKPRLKGIEISAPTPGNAAAIIIRSRRRKYLPGRWLFPIALYTWFSSSHNYITAIYESGARMAKEKKSVITVNVTSLRNAVCCAYKFKGFGKKRNLQKFRELSTDALHSYAACLEC